MEELISKYNLLRAPKWDNHSQNFIKNFKTYAFPIEIETWDIFIGDWNAFDGTELKEGMVCIFGIGKPTDKKVFFSFQVPIELLLDCEKEYIDKMVNREVEKVTKKYG